MSTPNLPMLLPRKRAWNKGRLVGQKRPLLPKHVWAIRVRLELAGSLRDLALFNLTVAATRTSVWVRKHARRACANACDRCDCQFKLA